MNKGSCTHAAQIAKASPGAGRRPAWVGSGDLLLPALVLAAGFLVSAMVYVRMARDSVDMERREFHADTERVAAEFSLSLRRFEFILQGARGLFLASDGVSPEKWDAYVGSLDPSRGMQGIVAIGYAARVAGPALAPSAGERPEGFDRNDHATPLQSVPGDRFPVVFHSLDEAARGPSVGEDLMAEPARRDAILRAGLADGVASTQTIELRGSDLDPGSRAGVMLLIGVYEGHVVRPQTLRGIVYVTLDIGQLVASMTSEMDDAPVQFNLHEGDSTEGARVYASNSTNVGVPADARYARRRVLHVSGTPWLLEFYATPGHPTWSAGREARLAMATGAALSVLSALLLLVVMRRQRRAAVHAARLERDHALDRAQLEGIVSSAMDAIVSLDADLRIVLYNAAAERMFGRLRTQMVGRSLDLLLPERSRAMHQRHLRRFVRSGTTIRSMGEPGCVFGLRADGSEFPIEASISSTGTAGEVLLTVIMRDISERLRAEGELRHHRDHLKELVDERTREYLRAKEEAEASDRAKSQFLANMSHELRTPMHAILSFSELGRKRIGTAPPEKIGGYFESIATSGKRLTVLIDDLLDLAKLEAGRTVLEVRSTRLDRLVQEAVAEIAPLLQERSLDVQFASSAPETKLDADALRLGQVVRNLLSNAVKFSRPCGSIRIDIEDAVFVSERGAGGEGRPALRLSIADRGPGIPDEELHSVFEKFVQSSKTRSGAGGTGLGLAICREIVQLHGGCIEARNRPGGGAILQFTIPCSREGAASAACTDHTAKEAA